jgi:hypothetical protein
MAPTPATTLAYEPIKPWITGMGVAEWKTDVASEGVLS